MLFVLCSVAAFAIFKNYLKAFGEVNTAEIVRDAKDPRPHGD